MYAIQHLYKNKLFQRPAPVPEKKANFILNHSDICNNATQHDNIAQENAQNSNNNNNNNNVIGLLIFNEYFFAAFDQY